MMGRKRSAAGVRDGGARIHAETALGFEREIHHHDGVLLDDADQQQDAEKGDQAEFGAGRQQREQRADAGGRQRRENGQRLTVAFVQHARARRRSRRSRPGASGRVAVALLEQPRRSVGAAAMSRARGCRSFLRSMASRRVPSDSPSGRLKAIDVDTDVPVWLTLTGVVPVVKWLKAENGTTVSVRC
jgi:hypothetical protein